MRGWPARLTEGPVGLRPFQVRDAATWVEVRLRNEQWLAPWEPTPQADAGSWVDRHTIGTYTVMLRALRKQARLGVALPFAITYEGRLCGQLTIGNIVLGAFRNAYAGYWVDSAVAGRGVMPTALAMGVDHAFSVVGLHRVEVNIRPENEPSLRVAEKLGLRREAFHERYLAIDGDWRDHVGFAITADEVPQGLLARWRETRGE